MAIIIKKIKTNDATSTFEINIRDKESGLQWIAKIKANHIREALEKCKQEVRFGWANLYINAVHEYRPDGKSVSYPQLYGYLDKVILEAKHKGYDSMLRDANPDTIAKLIADEEEAVRGYQKAIEEARANNDEAAIARYQHIIDEEMEHIQELKDLLANDPHKEVGDSTIKDASKWGVINAKISEWDPTTIIKRMKETRNGDMHTNLIDKKGNVHTVFLSAWGTIDKAEVWVDVVVETPEGKQDRVMMKKAASWDEALKIMQDYKRQHINDSKIKDDICSSENVKECVQDYRENAFGYDGIADYVQTNYPYHSKDEQDRLIAAMKKSMNDSKPQLLDAAKAQQLVDIIKKAKAAKMIKDEKIIYKGYIIEKSREWHPATGPHTPAGYSTVYIIRNAAGKKLGAKYELEWAKEMIDEHLPKVVDSAIKDSDRLSNLAYELGQLANYFDRANSAKSRQYLAKNDTEMLNKFYNKGLETLAVLKQEVENMEKYVKTDDKKYRFSFNNKTADLLSDAASRMYFIYSIVDGAAYKKFEVLGKRIEEYAKRYRKLAINDSAIKDDAIHIYFDFNADNSLTKEDYNDINRIARKCNVSATIYRQDGSEKFVRYSGTKAQLKKFSDELEHLGLNDVYEFELNNNPNRPYGMEYH